MISVSVIVTVYNSEKYLRDCLNSLMVQTLKNIEILCVDDGSSDNSVDIILEYAGKDDRIKLLRQNRPSDGAAAARNLGIDNAKGEYLSILDSDDFFDPDMLEKAYRQVKEDDADIVIYNGYGYDSITGKDIEVEYILHEELIDNSGRRVFSPSDYSERLYLLTLGAAWNCMFRRDYINSEDIRFQEYHHADDLGFVYLAFTCANNISVLNERLIHYRRNTGMGQAENLDPWSVACCEALAQLKEAIEKRGLFEKFKVAFINVALRYIVFYFGAIKSYDAFQRLYRLLHDRYMEQLALNEIMDTEILQPDFLVLRIALNELTPEDYLFRKLHWLEPFDRLMISESKREKRFSKKQRVAVYGAGIRGKNTVARLIRGELGGRLCAWVDREYETIGYPVQDPVDLILSEPDAVIIAIKDKNVAVEAGYNLINKGIKKEIIVWEKRNSFVNLFE